MINGHTLNLADHTDPHGYRMRVDFRQEKLIIFSPIGAVVHTAHLDDYTDFEGDANAYIEALLGPRVLEKPREPRKTFVQAALARNLKVHQPHPSNYRWRRNYYKSPVISLTARLKALIKAVPSVTPKVYACNLRAFKREGCRVTQVDFTNLYRVDTNNRRYSVELIEDE